MIGCQVVIFVILFCFLIPVESLCDSDEVMARQYQEKFCHLSKMVGSCKLKWKRFYFNRFTGRCEQFIYEGKLGNFHSEKNDSHSKLIIFLLQVAHQTEIILKLRPTVFPVAFPDETTNKIIIYKNNQSTIEKYASTHSRFGKRRVGWQTKLI